MNYKIRVANEAESKEAQELFFELGYMVVNNMDCEKGYIVASKNAESPINFDYWYDVKNTITIPQLKDMVVLKRGDVSDATHCTESCGAKGFLSSEGIEYFWEYGVKEWNKHKHSNFAEYEMKPITKEPTMRELLLKLKDGSFVYSNSEMDSVPHYVEAIEIPEGADTLAGDSSTRYFWKHGVGEKGNMIIGVGESLARYSGWTDCKDSADVWLDCVNDDSFKIIWQRHTHPEALPFIDDEPKYDPEDIGIAKGYDLDKLAKEYKLRNRCEGETDEEYRYMLEHCISKESINDKVASAEVARQEFIGAPFSDLPEFNFGAIDDFVESNVEQGAKHSHYKKDISHLNTLDIYRVTELFNPHSCGAHIAKKALCSGQRGHKDLLTDIQDIIDTAERWKEMLIEDEKAK